YAYLRQVTQAALVIQNQYRNYCENKRFKKSQESETTAGFLLPREANVNTNPASVILWDPMHSPKATERACRKREATMSVTHGAHCPAPAKIALSSAVQHQHRNQSQPPSTIQESNGNNNSSVTTNNNSNNNNNNSNNYYAHK
ncbi:unnamed protein product, partial [Allacma fusca]